MVVTASVVLLSMLAMDAGAAIKTPSDRFVRTANYYLKAGTDITASDYPKLAKYDLLDDQVVFLKGWFKDTLPTAPVAELAVLRLDGDMYESTMDALGALYDKVAERPGFVIYRKLL